MATLDPFVYHGVTLRPDIKSGGHTVADCIFCGEERHFFISPDAQWKCVKCGERGNLFTFLEKICTYFNELTTKAEWARLEQSRGLPKAAFEGLGFNGKIWIFPSRNNKGTVCDVRTWNGKGAVFATKGCSTQLWGMEILAKASRRTRVYLCEGEWDGMAMRWLLRRTDQKGIVVAVPGGDTFKPAWVPFFREMDVVICGDNDEVGDRMNSRDAKALAGTAWRTQFLNWPEIRPGGWDIRDHVVEGRKAAKSLPDVYNDLAMLISPDHRHLHQDPKGIEIAATDGPGAVSEPGEGFEPMVVSDAARPSFRAVLEAFKKWVRMDQDMEDGLRIILAVILSENIDGDPLWFHIVSPPGGGKTLLLCTTQTSDRTIFRSNVSPHSLISGFRADPDPSLLAIVNKRTLIFKDATTLLSLPIYQQDEIYGVFRDAYDGHVHRSFGNNVQREYYLHFSMLMGITPSIYGSKNASLGERFLKYHMRHSGSRDGQIEAALDNATHEIQMQKDLQKVVNPFLAREVKKIPGTPAWAKSRLVALAQIVAMLRATVEKDRYTDEVVYRPSYEVGTRLAKQLQKLGQSLALVEGKSEIDTEIYKLVERVAFDTATGYHVDLVKEIFNAGVPMLRDDLSRKANVPGSTLTRNLEDLLALGVVYKKEGESTVGRKPFEWGLTEKITTLWKKAQVLK